MKELNEKLERERKGQDPLELMEKTYEMAARYFPGQAGGQVKSIQSGGPSGNPAAIAAGRATELSLMHIWKERKRTKQAVSLEGKRHRILKKLKVVKDKNERSALIRQYKAYQKEGLQYSDGDEMDMNYRKLNSVRYADDFLI